MIHTDPIPMTRWDKIWDLLDVIVFLMISLRIATLEPERLVPTWVLRIQIQNQTNVHLALPLISF
jgi:hypothetical protein